jgi:hypothetical protein
MLIAGVGQGEKNRIKNFSGDDIRKWLIGTNDGLRRYTSLGNISEFGLQQCERLLWKALNNLERSEELQTALYTFVRDTYLNKEQYFRLALWVRNLNLHKGPKPTFDPCFIIKTLVERDDFGD